MPNEEFIVTAANRSDRSIYMVQFSLRVDDKTKRLNDFRLGIRPGSIKMLAHSKDRTNAVADILLFKCDDDMGDPLYVFFIPVLNAKESREVTIESVDHATSTVYAEPVYYDEDAHSVSLNNDSDVGFDLRLSSTSGARRCGPPTLSPIPIQQ